VRRGWERVDSGRKESLEANRGRERGEAGSKERMPPSWQNRG
jgi:hypothetical protein